MAAVEESQDGVVLEVEVTVDEGVPVDREARVDLEIDVASVVDPGLETRVLILDLCPFAALYVGRLVDCGQSIRKEKDEELASRVAQVS